MLVLFKKNGELYVKCKLNLRDSIKCNDIVFDKCVNKIDLIDPEVVSELLTINANIKLFVAGKFLKVNLGTYYDMISKKNYRIEEIKEQEKKVVKEESKPVVSQPEVEEEVEVEQPKKDNSKHNKSNNEDDNKKKRHKQNNNNNQGGDK